MPDLFLRFDKDMLVIARPAAAALLDKGVEAGHDADFALLFEPETVEDALMLDAATGAQCLVTPTVGCTPAKLLEWGMEGNGEALAAQAVRIVHALRPQHLLVEIGPCGLPLDPWNKGSLRENMDQYVRAARLFKELEFDAFLLSGFASAADMKCALMGIRKVSAAPILASVSVDEGGVMPDGSTLEEVLPMIVEYEANAAGIETDAAADAAAETIARAADILREASPASSPLPLMATLLVKEAAGNPLKSDAGNPYACADDMVAAAVALRDAGAQFLRASGAATPAYTGVLAGTMLGLDVRKTDAAPDGKAPSPEEMEAFIADAQARVAAALEGATGTAADDDEDFASYGDEEVPEAVKVSGFFPFQSFGEGRCR